MPDRAQLFAGWRTGFAEPHRQIGDDQLEDLLAALYGLHTLQLLHFTQEEGSYFALTPN